MLKIESECIQRENLRPQELAAQKQVADSGLGRPIHHHLLVTSWAKGCDMGLCSSSTWHKLTNPNLCLPLIDTAAGGVVVDRCTMAANMATGTFS